MKAVDYFHNTPERLNCAQAILTAWKDECGVSEEMIQNFKQFGGGKAPEGTCGALYAAEYLVQKQENVSVIGDFAKQTGSHACRSIRANGTVSCQRCVEIADELMSQKLKK